jgi:diguanylate cyclase (GGDEF)-like protein
MGMLSESTTAGSGSGVWLRQVLYARGSRVQLAGLAVGSALALAAAALWLAVPPMVALGVVGVAPVAVLGWYGGVWWGRASSVVMAGLQVAASVWHGRAAGPLLVGGGALAVVVLWAVGSAVPWLRFASQSYRDHSQMDPLTNLGNRRFFREVAAVELNRSKRYRRPVSLVYLEAESFEQIKQESGHAAGEELLVRMSNVLTGTLRASDVVARLTDAEFAILLPETSGPGAQVVADKLRERLSEATGEAGHRLVFRAAVVGFTEGSVALEAMLRQADEAMAESRRVGQAALSYRDYVHPPMQLV